MIHADVYNLQKVVPIKLILAMLLSTEIRSIINTDYQMINTSELAIPLFVEITSIYFVLALCKFNIINKHEKNTQF